MIRQAVQAKEQVRALDLAGMLHLPKSISIAKYLAEESNMTELGRRMDQLLEAKKILVQNKKDADDKQRLLDDLLVEKKDHRLSAQKGKEKEKEKEKERQREKETEQERSGNARRPSGSGDIRPYMIAMPKPWRTG